MYVHSKRRCARARGAPSVFIVTLRFVMTEEEITNRMAKIRAWLEHIACRYEDLLSRASETASMSGFDDRPRRIPCEHRSAWMRGNLCIACGNEGWRLATAAEREAGLALDPYSVWAGGSHAIVATETVSRARSLRRLEAALARLRRDALIREGIQGQENSESRMLRAVGQKERSEHKILVGLEYLRLHHHDLYVDPYGYETLRFLAHSIPGRIRHPEEAR